METVDLTMPLDEGTPTYPDDPDTEVKDTATVDDDGYAVKRLAFGSHVGTHIDAPAHMIEGGRTLDDYPPESFVGEAVVVDVRGQEVIQTDLSCLAEDTEILLFRTGHSEGYGQRYHDGFPVVSEETANEVVGSEIGILGIDSPSPDEPPYPVHEMLLSNGVLLLENLTNLGAVTGESFRCCALPLKIVDGDGAPCRVAGVVD
jgi:kynurenine formamidase